jgi:hypothetical protein
MEKISIYPSAVATFYAPSDICGAGGMRSERIRAVTSWRNGASRFDTVFVSTDPTAEGMRGLDVARVRLFFSFSYEGVLYPCALVHWYSRKGDSPDDTTGMWIVEPDGHRMMTVKPLPPSFTLIPSFEQPTSFQYSALSVYHGLFLLRTHLINFLASTSTNMLITTHSRLPFDTLATFHIRQ